MHRAFLLRDLLRVALPLPVATMVATTAAPTCGRSAPRRPGARARGPSSQGHASLFLTFDRLFIA